MENSLSAEYSVNDFDEAKYLDKEEVNDKTQIEPEKLFVEAVQKLNSYEHSLETLMKRFDMDGSEVQGSDSAPGGTDPSAGGDRPISGRELQKYVKIRIPFHTAEVILRILDENLDKKQRSVLKKAESYLNAARQNLENVRELIRIETENSDKSREPVLRQTSEIVDDMLTIMNKLNEKLLECQVQKVSELLARAMKDENRLTKLVTEKRAVEDRSQETPEQRDDEKPVSSLVSVKQSSSRAFYATLFVCVACLFVLRMAFLYMERDKKALEKACLFIWEYFQK